MPRTIGRICNVLPIQGEKFYLRLMLNHRTGATSFTDLKTLNGKEYDTYKEICLEMGLLEDDGEWKTSMEEVSQHAMPHQIRATFAVILQYCQPTKPRVLFDSFLHSRSEDFVNKKMKERGNITLEQAENYEVTHCVLRAIDEDLGT